ncbi:uncharacterized protein LOC131843040 [Achroia grisella]|uniref:uncharacterized protein LOC131843040 n=1 Tax=Achroia grisella TaxID=688607 RepID=UPI0027D20CEE|nr:uncharacterized protein LOC131843040 [Achroia grisella]
MSSLSKASHKSEDDFDVNEYFARLQGTRYVSAPLNSLRKEDKNANLEATEENLEEINLNEPEKLQNSEIQQSLTADIAQNFSQLPTVLPQVASAVFSSFSNMLSMKSREQTPDEVKVNSGYQEVQFQRPEDIGVPLMGVEQQVKEVAPPPKEPPLTGTSNYRITTKKKAYAQIPGLSSGDNTQSLPLRPPMGQPNIPPFFTSTIPNIQSNDANLDNNRRLTIEANTNIQQGINVFNPVHPDSNNEETTLFHPVVNYNEPNLYDNMAKENIGAIGQPSNSAIQFYGQDSQTAAIAQATPPIIPPPPMFSSAPKKDSQIVGKSVLPPSVARRISTSHPIIKPSITQTSVLASNIFVPHLNPTAVDNSQNSLNMGLHNEAQNAAPTVITPMFDSASQPALSNISGTSVMTPDTTQIPNEAKNISHQQLSTAFSVSGSNIPVDDFMQTNISNIATIDQQSNIQATSSSTAALFDIQSSNIQPVPSNIFTPSYSYKDSEQSFTPTTTSASINIFQTNIQPVFEQKNSTSTNTIPFNNQGHMLQSPTVAQNIPPSIFNPSISQSIRSDGLMQSSQEYTNVVQPQIAEPPKLLAEPPKSTGNVSYRLTKKRPQYYAGPIEGIGSISNNMKPLLPTVESSSFQGALFTPSQQNLPPLEQEIVAPNIDEATVPLINKHENTSYAQFELSKTPEYPLTNMQSDYNTAFDLSRSTTDKYEQPQQETKGFGIIGSLKSKLSSIDINKIQNTVTTFFDPGYNDTKNEAFNRDNMPPRDQSNTQPAYNSQEFGIFVPSEQPQIPAQTYDYQSYQNLYNYNQNAQYPMQDSNNYYQNQDQTQLHSANYYTNLNQDHVPNYNTASYTPTPVIATDQNIFHNQQVSDINLTNAGGINTASITLGTSKENIEYVPNVSVPVQGAAGDNITANINKDEFNLPIPGFFNFTSQTQTIPLNKTPDLQESFNISSIYDNVSNNVIDTTTHIVEHKSAVTEDFITNTHTETSLQVTAQVKHENIVPSEAIHSLHSSSQNHEDIKTANTVIERPHHVSENPETKNYFLSKESLLMSAKNHIQIPENTFSKFSFDVDNKDTILFHNNQVLNDKNLTRHVHSDSSKQYNLNNTPGTSLESTKLDSLMKNVTLNEIQKSESEESVYARKDSENIICKEKILDNNQENDSVSNFNICETCREVNKPEDKEADDLTTQLIENIIAPIQLLNPVEVPLTESSTPVDERIDFDTEQCAEISHIAEETIETHQLQSATKLLGDKPLENISTRGYGWCTENTLATSKNFIDHDYSFQIDTNSIGFYGGNSLFFDNVPNNASDEIKAEYKNSQEDIPLVLPRQMSIPSAPAPDDDSKSDETGLDVLSIEQDANIDFPLFEEFVIDPSETDDDKIEYKERERSSEDPIPEVDTFTNRVEKFKKMEETAVEGHDDAFNIKKTQRVDVITTNNPAITIASYFDTGNYAVETHYKNSTSFPYVRFGSPNEVIRIPPGFEDEFKRKFSGMSIEELYGSNKKEPYVPDTFTQTQPSNSPTYSTASRPLGELLKSQQKESRKSSSTSEKLPPLASIFGDNILQKQTEPNQQLPTTNTEKSLLTSEISSAMVFADSKKEDLPFVESKKEEYNAKLDKPLFGNTSVTAENTGTLHLFSEKSSPIIEEKQSQTQPLPDPINFFSSTEKTTSKKQEEENENNFNRLASYFTGSTNSDPVKSFFELSQSQNHYRHASSKNKPNTENNNYNQQNSQSSLNQDNLSNIPHDQSLRNLMKDLTSFQNFKNDQVVRTVNYFTVEYDNVNINEIKIGEPNYSQILDKEIGNKVSSTVNSDENKLEEMSNVQHCLSILTRCKYCCNNVTSVLHKNYSDKKAMDSENTESKRESGSNMERNKAGASQKDVTVTFQNDNEESNEEVGVLTEQRHVAEYIPVKHHWFYRVDLENKSMWRGFSVVDSMALEEAYHSPTLDENTLVATDGGRYDVNVIGRLRIAVYWSDKPTNVMRCSWFYKGTTDPRYVPYTEEIAEKLEEEYRHGITTGEWHRRLLLPNNESVVMHGPAVMVHLLQNATDAFSSTPLFTFGKRVYRSPLKIRVPGDQREEIDHLLLLVHGAGEYRIQKEKNQSSMRPRVVRRGWDESEIEDTEPSSVDHLLLFCHGVGSACDMRFRSVEEVVDDFRATSLQLVKSHYRNSYENGAVNRVEVLPISWHSTLHSGETGVDRRIAQITLDSIPKLRTFTNETVLDVLFYTSPIFCQTIIDTVCSEMNRIYKLFRARNPKFNGRVSLGGHSLGSVILYDLLCHQPDEEASDKNYVSGPAGTGQESVRFPRLEFSPAALYAFGSPIAIFECIRGVESLGADFALPTCKNFFNIFHPYDPIAYRIEPLINPRLKSVKPYLIPHHKGRKRMHLELKETMARVGADLKQKLLESLKATWTSMWRTPPPPNDGQLEKVVEEEMEKENLCEENKDVIPQDIDASTPEVMGRLNNGRRVDFVLQEAPFEMINEYLFAMTSHVCYWESEDTMLMILREVYSSMGVQPDGSVPQQSLTVQRTRLQREDETIIVNTTDHPSTSRGET